MSNTHKCSENGCILELGNIIHRNMKPGQIMWMEDLTETVIRPPVGQTESIEGMKDSGSRNVLPSGMWLEPKEGKGRFDLIPSQPLERLAIWYEKGGKKYTDNNWKKGQQWSLCLNSLIRHVNEWKKGDRSEDHLAAIAWRAFALMYYEDEKPELCDIDEITSRIAEDKK